MEPERWAQVEELCRRALELDDNRRTEFLKQSCGEDEVLRREVESLLAHEKEAEQTSRQRTSNHRGWSEPDWHYSFPLSHY